MERFAGRYGLLKLLGKGGTGEVHLAVDLETGAEVAIKQFTGVSDERALAMVRREFEALARVRHPAVVRVLDLKSDFEGRPFLVMEYVAGWAAQHVVRPGELTDLAFLAVRVAAGLEAIHAAGIAHGDLKPENILIGAAEGRGPLRDVKIVDFGFSGLAGAGTAGYSAPAIVNGEKANARDDLYSFGATLFRLASGRDPFEGANDDERLHRQLAGPPSSLPLEEAEVPDSWIRLILQLLAVQPAERPRTATDVRRAIEQFSPSARVPLADRIAGESLVGRQTELARLEREWLRASKGARTLVLTGESGIGKSALLEAFAARGVLGSRSVVRVAGSSGGAPGAVWRTAARRLAAEARVDLATAEPDLRDALGEHAGTPDEVVQARVGGAIEEWCRLILEVREHPVCVLLDDADELDELSLRLLRRPMLAGSAAPALWVLARRSDGGAADAQEQLMVAAGNAAEVMIPPLDGPGVERLAAARLGAEAGDDLVAFLWERAAGHPGLTVESLRIAAVSGAVREGEFGVLVDTGALLNLPPLTDFESTRLARVEALPEAARRAALVLALYGRPVELHEAQRADPQVTPEAFATLLARGVAVVDERQRWCLTPAVLGVRLAEAASPEARRSLHEAIVTGGDLSARERFHHLASAGRIAEALKTADEAFAEGADVEIALRAAGLAQNDAQLAARWLARAARAHMDNGRYRDAAPLLVQALERDADSSSRPERWGMLSTCRYRTGDLERLQRETEQARREPLDDSARALLGLNEAARLASQGQLEKSLTTAIAARALAPSSGDLTILGAALVTEANALLQLGRLEESSRCVKELLEVAERSAQPIVKARATCMAALLDEMKGDLPHAESLLRSAFDDALRQSSRFALEDLAAVYYTILVTLGKWPEARAVRAMALRRALEDGRDVGTAAAMISLGHLDGLMGDLRSARRETRHSIALCRKHAPALQSYVLRTMALVWRSTGRLRKAARVAERAVTIARSRAGREEADWSVIELLRVRARLGKWSAVSALSESVLADGGRKPTVGGVVIASFSSRAALRDGRLEDAHSGLNRLLEWTREIDGRYANAHALLLRAEIALRTQAADREEVVDRALTAFTELPATPDHAAAALEVARLAIEWKSASSAAIQRWLDLAMVGFDRLGDRLGCEQVATLGMGWLRAEGQSEPEPGQARNLIGAVSELLDSFSDFSELTRRAMKLVVKQLNAERGLLLLKNPDSGELEICAEHGSLDADAVHEAGEFSRKAIDRTMKSGYSLLIHDAERHPQANTPSVERLRIKSILSVPLFHTGLPIGAVYLDHTRRYGAFTEADRKLIEGFTGLMATAIANSRGADKVRRTNEELTDENITLRREVERKAFRPKEFIGKSLAISKVLDVVERAADLTTTVLITGENGTGKEKVARSIHYSGKRKAGPFVLVNCGAIPETLIESELFGYRRGAFTGADKDHDGKFVQAHGGTLFLDEIGEMPINHQVRLLSVLENREVVPLNGREPVRFDARVIAATNRNLLELIHEKRFRQDLYERLHVLTIEVPPLREHKADIPDLVRHFVEKVAEVQEREIPKLSRDFLATAMQSDWPGNTRELGNYIERVMALTPGNLLKPDPLPRDMQGRDPEPSKKVTGGLVAQLEALEKKVLEQTLEQCEWNQSLAARTLKMKEQTLRYRLGKHKLLEPRKNSRIRKKQR